MEKRELRTALFFIIVYVIAMSIADGLSAKIGIEKSVTALTAIIFFGWNFLFYKKTTANIGIRICRCQKSAWQLPILHSACSDSIRKPLERSKNELLCRGNRSLHNKYGLCRLS